MLKHGIKSYDISYFTGRFCKKSGVISMKEKAFPYLITALLSFVLLGLELLVLFVGSLFYGTMDFAQLAETQVRLHYQHTPHPLIWRYPKTAYDTPANL